MLQAAGGARDANDGKAQYQQAASDAYARCNSAVSASVMLASGVG